MSKVGEFIYTKLNNDNSLQLLISDRIFADVAPASAEYPLVVFSQIDSVPIMNFSSDIVADTELWQIVVWDNKPSFSSNETIADRIVQILHKASGGSSGVIGVVFNSKVRISEEDGDKIFKGIVLEFKFFIQ